MWCYGANWLVYACPLLPFEGTNTLNELVGRFQSSVDELIAHEAAHRLLWEACHGIFLQPHEPFGIEERSLRLVVSRES